MAIGGAVFAAGRYTITWNSLDLGIMEGDANSPVIDFTGFGEPINNSDAYGRSTIGAIYQGADWFAQWTFLEYKAAVKSALWPFHATFGNMGTIGREYTDTLAQALVFTVVAGTAAATAGPSTITASKACLAPNFNPRILYGPKLRTIPCRMQLFPFVSASNNVYFTET